MKLKSIDISKLISVAGSPGDEGVVKNWVLMVYVHATFFLVLYPASIGNMGRIGAFHCCDVALVRQRGHSCVGVAHCAAVCCILPPFFSGGSIRPPLKKGVSIQHCVMAAAILLEDRVEVVMHMLFDTENGDIFLHEHPFSRAPTTTHMLNP